MITSGTSSRIARDRVPSEAPGTPGLEVTGLLKRYGRVLALDGCSLQVPPGHLVGLLGPNGAGKTTVMRTLFGLVVPDAGTVWWRGRPVDGRCWQRFGYMPEERGLYPGMRVKEQIIYFGRLGGLSAGDAAAAADRWLGRLGWPGGRTAGSTGCRTATSSGFSWRWRWCTTPSWWCSMSRSPGWTRSLSMRSRR
jgi:energy-coupling factor transporter ATP-binding protein EcfA2